MSNWFCLFWLLFSPLAWVCLAWAASLYGLGHPPTRPTDDPPPPACVGTDRRETERFEFCGSMNNARQVVRISHVANESEGSVGRSTGSLACIQTNVGRFDGWIGVAPSVARSCLLDRDRMAKGPCFAVIRACPCPRACTTDHDSDRITFPSPHTQMTHRQSLPRRDPFMVVPYLIRIANGKTRERPP